MSADEMKQDAAVKINWFTINVPTLAMVVMASSFITVGFNDLGRSVDSLKYDNESLKKTTADINNIVYRVEQLEVGLHKANERTDSLQNTLLSGMDLMRRDINRLTTQFEVLSSRVGMVIGDVDEPKQRRARPAPPSLD